MRPGFGDAAVLDHIDAARLDHCLQAMCHDEGGPPPPQFVERLLHLAFRFRIERGGRLVEQKDRRVLQEGAGDGDALLLAAGKLGAELADISVVAEAKAADEGVRMGRPGRGDDFTLARAGLAERDIVADRAPKQIDVLAHITDRRSQRGDVHFACVLAVDPDHRPSSDRRSAERG